MTPATLAQGYRHGPYAWPGGYPVYLILEDGESLCWSCLKNEYRYIVHSDRGDGWFPLSFEILWEVDEDELCALCACTLEPAYS